MKAVQFLLAIPISIPGATPLPLELELRIQNICAVGPRLWTNNAAPLIKVGEQSYLLGCVFDRRSALPVTSLPGTAASAPSASAFAKYLVGNFWGGYVAILRGTADHSYQIMVDPSGLMPAYRIQTDTHILIASDPGLLNEQSSRKLKISPENLRGYLLRPDLRRRTTCLADVTELTPGELIWATQSSGQGTRLWRPDEFMPSGTPPSFTEAAEELRSLSVKVMGAWSTALGPASVAASGGVDSSFICGALAGADEYFTCVTLATTDPSGDERSFVQLLSRHLGTSTIGAFFDLSSIDPRVAASVGLARPTRKSFMVALESALFAAADNVGAHVIFDGNGGDNIFCFLHSAAPIVDRLQCSGPGRGTLSTFFDMCRVTDCDIAAMGKAAVRRLIRGSGFKPWPSDTRLLHSPFEDDTLDPLTPWFETSVGRHRGKYDHLSLIMRTQNHVHGLAEGGLPRFSPLMSQPLVEFCLGVPTWIWCKDGINRSLARAAFAADLPREILQRTSKAGPDSFVRRIYDEHRAVMRELLMDGLLVQHELLDRPALEQALESDGMSGGSIVYRLLDIAEAENWARSWQC